ELRSGRTTKRTKKKTTKKRSKRAITRTTKRTTKRTLKTSGIDKRQLPLVVQQRISRSTRSRRHCPEGRQPTAATTQHTNVRRLARQHPLEPPPSLGRVNVAATMFSQLFVLSPRGDIL